MKLEGRNDKLLANGAPLAINKTLLKDTILRHGGSGGFVYIKVTQLLSKNSIESGSRIVANGGNGKNGGYGGSGGIIILDKVLIGSEFVNATPGYT